MPGEIYDLIDSMNIHNLSVLGREFWRFKVFDLHVCFYFIKYCKEMPGEIHDFISSHEY